MEEIINAKIKELEAEIKDMEGSSPIILAIPKAQLAVLNEIMKNGKINNK